MPLAKIRARPARRPRLTAKKATVEASCPLCPLLTLLTDNACLTDNVWFHVKPGTVLQRVEGLSLPMECLQRQHACHEFSSRPHGPQRCNRGLSTPSHVPTDCASLRSPFRPGPGPPCGRRDSGLPDEAFRRWGQVKFQLRVNTLQPQTLSAKKGGLQNDVVCRILHDGRCEPAMEEAGLPTNLSRFQLQLCV